MNAIRVGSAPDSWGVWYADDARQLPYQRFLDEVAAAGYRWIELGPYGYLPTDPARLRDELGTRGLSLSAGTVFEHLHRTDSWETVWRTVSAVAELTAAAGGRHLVVIPELWRDATTGERHESRALDPTGWDRKTNGIDRLARAVAESYGIALQYHPHADSHVSTVADVHRFLEATDPTVVNLCLDTGHIAYTGGDSMEIVARWPERIGYLHLKQVDPVLAADAVATDLPFGAAVERGVMVEPPSGAPDFPPLLGELERRGIEVFAIVEQDMYPCDFDTPLPIARRTRVYLSGCGVRA